MSKDAINQYDKVAANNTDVGGVNTSETMVPSAVNDAFREVMSHLADVNDGSATLTSPSISGNLSVSGTVDGRDVATDGTKLDGVAASANNYAHPNHSGEVTSTADGATVIADNVVDEANLKISNVPTDGYVITAAASASGGMSWAAASGGATNIDGLSDAVTKSSGRTIGLGTGALVNDDGTNNDNTAVGYQTGNAITTGFHNTAVGYQAGKAITTGNENSFFGYQAGRDLTTGWYNCLYGKSSGSGITTGHTNTAMGMYALSNATTAANNIAIGYSTLSQVVTYGNNVAVGVQAGANTTGEDNTYVGTSAAFNKTGGSKNVSIGYQAMSGGSGAAANNVSVGSYSMYDSTTLTTSTALGHWAGKTAVSGSNNCFIGNTAYGSSTTVSNEITLGNTAITKFRIPGINFVIKDTTATDNYVLTVDANGEAGWEAAAGGATNINGLSDGKTIGGSAGTAAHEQYSIGLGYQAFNSATAQAAATGASVALGWYAGAKTTTGQQNVYIGGSNANYNTNTASYNIGIGPRALQGVTTGGSNTVVGTNGSGQNISTGTHNCLFGYTTGRVITTGSYNIGIGSDSLYDVGTTDYNIAIGESAGYTGAGGNCIMIGKQALASSSSATNEITLGNSSISSLRCQVQTISALSDRRDKKDIEELPLGIDFINTLKPVKFTWNMRDGVKVGQQEAGFIAQDLDEAQIDADAEDYLNLVLKNNPEKLEASYGKLVPVLVKAVQELSAEVTTLKKEIENGKRKNR